MGLLAKNLPTTKIQGNSSIEALGEGGVPGLVVWLSRQTFESAAYWVLHAVCSFPMWMIKLLRS